MSPAPSPRSRIFDVSGRYHIQRKLGTGSMGTVYLAHDEVAGRPVALKLLRVEKLEPARGLEDLQQEFRAIANLRHSQIASAYDFGYTQDSQVPFYTREYVEGVPLPGGPPRESRDITRQEREPRTDSRWTLPRRHPRGTRTSGVASRT
jgi:serine/threonine protein kinase